MTLVSRPEEECRKPSDQLPPWHGRGGKRREAEALPFPQKARQGGNRNAKCMLGVGNRSIPHWNNKALQENEMGRQKEEVAFNR